MKPAMLLSKMIVLAAGLAASGVIAGDWGKAPAGKSPIEECVDLGGEISVGYESDYLFYGVLYAGDSVWTDINYTYEGLPLPLTMGVWYLNGINGPGAGTTSSTPISTRRSPTSRVRGQFRLLSLRLHRVPQQRVSERRLRRSLCGSHAQPRLRRCDLRPHRGDGRRRIGRGWYHELGFEKTIELCDKAGLVLGGGVGYTDNYYDTVLYGSNRDSGWNHYYLRASLPIYLNCRTTLTPYIGYNGAPDTWIADGIDAGVEGPQTDILHGGVALTVAF